MEINQKIGCLLAKTDHLENKDFKVCLMELILISLLDSQMIQ